MRLEILRLRKMIRGANRLIPLRMRGQWLVVCFLMIYSAGSWATTYYVSSSTGNDTNNGSSSSPWQTVAHVNGQTFNPGDSILFKRGDTWNEILVPASSGSSGNPITFDAYGAGAAPNLTGYYAVPSSAWVLVTGNAWKAAVPATYTTINYCLFGSIWGQKVAAATSNLTVKGNFYFANGYLYIFSSGSPGAFYNEAIVPMALSNVPVININGRSWLTIQHFLVNWFDQYGVYVQGASDHLVFANMEADSMIPQGTQPLGFYVNENSPGPGDLKIYNDEAHLNYDGFRFDGAATAIAMVNDKAYANRDGALVDNTGAVTYSYCHFYASSLAVAGSTDVEWTSGTGPVAGLGNVPADTAPAVQAYQRYPAEVTLTVDDEGMTPGADTYYASTVLPIADAAGVPVGAAITVGWPLAQTLISEFQGWINAGRDVTSHSISHTYYTNTDALEIQYTGSGTAATLSISNNTLSITVTGASDSVSFDLAQGQAEGTIKALRLALLATGKFTATEIQTCQGPYGTGCSAYTESALLAQDLADVSGQDVRTAVYHMQLDVTRLTTDEITLSRKWMTTNLTGLPATPVYVYPGGYETTAMQGITAGVAYAGARGALKEDLGVKDTYADGFNVENITSFGVNPSWMGLAPAVLNQKIQALVWKESVWGVPWGIFWHLNELINNDPVGGTEITNLIQDFKASGATVQTNTELVNWLLSGTQETGTDGSNYYTFPATSTLLDFRPTAISPVVDAGQNLGAAYELDINGVNQNSYGTAWEIGAHVYQGYAVYGLGAGSGQFIVGSAPNQNSVYQAYTGAAVVPWPAVPNMGGLTKNGAVFTDASYPSGTPSKVIRCTDARISPNDSNKSLSAGLGGSGDAMQMFNSDSTLMRVNTSGGAGRIVLFNPTTLVCGNPTAGPTLGSVITQYENMDSPGSATASVQFGQGSFDWSNPSSYYQFGVNQTQEVAYNINASTGQFNVDTTKGTGGTMSDFIYALPYNSSNATNAPSWQASHNYSTGQYVTYTMQSTDSLRPFDWIASTAYQAGDIIQPSANNTLNCAFKVFVAGTTGTTEPNWNVANCQPTYGPVPEGGTDGSVSWRPIGPPVFTFQLTSTGGTSGTSTPPFVPAATGHPDLMTGPGIGSGASDNGLVWTNTGPMTVPLWNSYAGISHDATRVCTGLSTNSYGYNSNYTAYNDDQGTGIFALCYNSATNVYYLLNTATGIQSQSACVGGIGYNCSGGTWSMTTEGTNSQIASGGCGFFIHNMKGSYTMDYPVVAQQAPLAGATGCPTGNAWSWAVFSPFNSTTTAQKYYASLNHWTIGNTHLVNIGQGCLDNSLGGSGCPVGTYGSVSGVFGNLYSAKAPYTLPLANWEPTCTTSWSPNNALPPCQLSLAYDSHMSWASNPGGSDTAPVCGSVYNLATLAPPPNAPWQGEVVCVSTTPSWSNPASPSGGQTQWRFTHEFNTGGSSFFDVQFAISQLSNDGRYVAFTSDWNCTLGTTSGGTTSVCGPPWVGGTAYSVGQYVNPFSSTGGSGTNYGVYEITTGGTSAAAHPAWFVCNSSTAGNTVTDTNGVVYSCVGQSNQRGDVFVVQLHS
ncbi:MAG: hypothetical protein WBV69_13675 [Candidatus Sulfotelmatobacter sp.]